MEYRNNILTFLFYTTLRAAQAERPVASALADSAASAAVVATGALDENSPPSARRADQASFGAERTPAALAEPRIPAEFTTGGADPLGMKLLVCWCMLRRRRWRRDRR
ncbi:MAG: hypothetical protein ABR970_05220 [Roseiarcus sp.]